MHDCCRLGRTSTSTIAWHLLHIGQHLSIGHRLFSTRSCSSLLFGTNQLCRSILIQHLCLWSSAILCLFIIHFTLKIIPAEPGHFQRSFIQFQKLTKEKNNKKTNTHSFHHHKKTIILPFFQNFIQQPNNFIINNKRYE